MPAAPNRPSRRPDLVYYPDTAPGIRRQRRGRGFSYIAPDGTTIARGAERQRIEALAVPPAYCDVWICPKPDGYLQATGRDARARKQYRYHPDWTAYRSLHKYDHLADFGAALPRIRRRILQDLKGDPGDRDFAIAAVLALLDRASMRIGNPEYARENGTFGATTLRPRHVSLSGSEIKLHYPAKGGHKVRKTLRDATLNRTLARLDDLPGTSLVAWVDEAGAPHQVTSDAVNTRLVDLTGQEAVTAKTFRTWNGSVAALEAALGPGKRTITAMAEAAAARLHNTPAIARNSYIHPAVTELTDEDAGDRVERLKEVESRSGLRRAEAQLLALLQG
ncbi:DNA topoisomerase IB [uncultured Roseobacter sp.]|uniref:DNA topoisomerase IB n=1 Tax=uncultured Roseobacter sp. TaxID=114847 RepID=UPI0026189EA8|nr:DNA topoisomerase IB [uncultured Roseobacter sp.]